MCVHVRTDTALFLLDKGNDLSCFLMMVLLMFVCMQKLTLIFFLLDKGNYISCFFLIVL